MARTTGTQRLLLALVMSVGGVLGIVGLQCQGTVAGPAVHMIAGNSNPPMPH